jgi:hypothetical protein
LEPGAVVGWFLLKTEPFPSFALIDFYDSFLFIGAA